MGQGKPIHQLAITSCGWAFLICSPCNMLRKLFVLVFSITSATYAQEQTSHTIKYPSRIISQFEFLVGANLIYARGSDFMKEARVGKIGFNSTLGLYHNFNTTWDLGIQISYQQKGYKFEVFSENAGPPPTDKATTDVTLNYVTATFFPRYSIIPSRKFQIGLGPYLGYLSTTRLVQKQFFQGDLVNKYSSRPDPGSDYENLDWGVSFQAGANFPFNDRRDLSIQFLYSLGIADINKPTIDKINNSTFSLLVGLHINRNSQP